MISLIVTGPILGEALAQLRCRSRNAATVAGSSCPKVCATSGQNCVPPEVAFKPVAATRPKEVLFSTAPKCTSEPKPVRAPPPSHPPREALHHLSGRARRARRRQQNRPVIYLVVAPRDDRARRDLKLLWGHLVVAQPPATDFHVPGVRAARDETIPGSSRRICASPASCTTRSWFRGRTISTGTKRSSASVSLTAYWSTTVRSRRGTCAPPGLGSMPCARRKWHARRRQPALPEIRTTSPLRSTPRAAL